MARRLNAMSTYGENPKEFSPLIYGYNNIPLHLISAFFISLVLLGSYYLLMN